MPQRPTDDMFSAAAMANRRAAKDLEGYERAFPIRDRLLGRTSAPLSAEEQSEKLAKDE